ncbi:MAG: glycoside hydrolase family 38 C-terminal domain-containing protein, partial [Gemmatimonadales bacterium]
IVAMNTLSSVITNATESVSEALNTNVTGTPVVVYNTLNIARADPVDVWVKSPAPAGAGAGVSVTGPDGRAVPAQLLGTDGDSAHVVFVAKAPSVGYAVYGVNIGSSSAAPASTGLSVSPTSLENARYRVTLNSAGDIASIRDKKLGRELLTAPIRLAFLQDNPQQWPAWNMDFSDEQRPPRGYVSGPANIKVVENGPARVAVQVARQVDSSRFVQTVSLAAGDAGSRIEISNVIDWRMPETALKATFPLTASDTVATYNWDVGTMKRANAYDRKFEVPSHQWIDLTDRSGKYGVTILTDDKNGSDKPDDNTIRLTLLRTPGVRGGYPDQATQDFGHHEFRYGLASHAGDYRTGQTDWEALRLNVPLMAFTASRHTGRLGREFSVLKVSDPRVRVMALKKAEASDELIVRIVELDGRPHQNIRISFASPVTAAREVNGQEQPVGRATVTGGALVTSLKPFAIRSFAVRIAAPSAREGRLRSAPVALSYDRAVASHDGEHSTGGFDSDGGALPAEMLPRTIAWNGVSFDLAPGGAGSADAVTPHGQTIALPAGRWTRAYVLAASASGDTPVTFTAGAAPTTVTVEHWGGFVGQWDDRVWKQIPAPPPTPEQIAQQQQRQARFDSLRRARVDSVLKAGGDTTKIPAFRGRGNRGPRMLDVVDHIVPGFIKPADIAWFASHHHDATGANQYYQYSYLFAYPIEIPPGATSITLPTAPDVRIMAITVANPPGTVVPAAPLHDTLGRAAP